MTQPQAEFFDLYRAGLKTAAEFMITSLESVERLQNQQLVAIRNALEQQSKSASELVEAKSLDELMALQSRMAGAQLERAMGYWSELCQAASENQVGAISQMHQQMAQARDWLSESYALTAKATEEIARFAQAATSNAAVRERQEQQRESA